MKWFLWFVLVLALIAGALYGVGRFILPNTLEVTRTAAVERPRARVVVDEVFGGDDGHGRYERRERTATG